MPSHAHSAWLTVWAVMLLSCGGCSGEGADTRPEALIVLAATSTVGPVQDAARSFEQATGVPVRISLGSSSTLTTQIDHGMRAHVFVSAHARFTRKLEESGHIERGSRRLVARNRLVLVTPKGRTVPVSLRPDFPIETVLIGPFVMGDPAHVPLGIYGKAALERLGWWKRLEDRVVSALDARSALRLVEEGGCGGGLLYASDAASSSRVEIIATFALSPGSTVTCEAGLLTSAHHPQDRQFMEFLGGAAGAGFWNSHGFLAAGRDATPEPAATPASTMELEGSHFGAIGLSLQVAALATLCSLPFAIALAWLLARREFLGKVLLEALITLPLVLPPVVIGYLLLATLGAGAPMGAFLEETIGVSLAFTWQGAALASAVMGFPLMVRAMRISLETVDRRLEQAARTLGAGPCRSFFSVSVPLAMPGLVAGVLLGFARSLGEFGATITFVGNMAGSTQTLPLRLFTEMQRPGAGGGALWLVVAAILLSVGAVSLGEILNRRLRARSAR